MLEIGLVFQIVDLSSKTNHMELLGAPKDKEKSQKEFIMKKWKDSLVDSEKLEKIAAEENRFYDGQSPFPHAVFDGVFEDDLLEEVITEFSQTDKGWRDFRTKYEHKSQQCMDENLGHITRQLIHTLNSSLFLTFLTQLTGIRGLIPDPYLAGGGLHKISRGGKLGIHVDFNKHKSMNVFRRINVIIYLNKNWKNKYGGQLELWDQNKTQMVKEISPIFNRMVVFNTSSDSFHGHPKPLQCPASVNRMSLALYYYTAYECGTQNKKSHGTLFLNEKNEVHSIGKPKGICKASYILRKVLDCLAKKEAK